MPTMLIFLQEDLSDIKELYGVYLPNLYNGGDDPKYDSGEAFYETYNHHMSFIHPFKLEGAMKVSNQNFFTNMVVEHGDMVRKVCTNGSSGLW